jgi:hypothetical protein
MSDTVQSAPDQPAIRFQCRHIRASGRPCGVAALRGLFFCYYHTAARRPVQTRNRSRFYESTLQAFGLPIIEDRVSLQLALSHVISRIASNDVDAKRAGKLLYGLQLASTNIALRLAETNLPPTAVDGRTSANNPPVTPEPEPIADPVRHEVFGPLAPVTEFHSPHTTPSTVSQPPILPAIRASASEPDSETLDHAAPINTSTDNARPQLRLPNQHTRRKHQPATDNHLQETQREARFEVLMPDQRNHHQLNPNHAICPGQSRMHVRNQERQRVQKAPDESHQPSNNPAEHRIAAPRQFAVIRQALRESHRDSGAHR